MKKTDNDVYIVSLPDARIYTIVGCLRELTAEQEIKRAYEQKERDLLKYKENAMLYDMEYWTNEYNKLKDRTYQAMSLDKFHELQRAYLINGKLEEITEELFNEQLNVLPPLKWCTINGIDMFCMSEMYTSTYTSQYARVGEKYYTTMVDICDKSTWIHNLL